jgi:hypothetical protein
MAKVNELPTDHNKAVGGATGTAGGIGIGGAIATIVVARWWRDADPNTAVALATIVNVALGAAGAYLGAYLTPHNDAS